MPRVQPSSPEVSRRMAKIRQKGTGAEIVLRRELYQRGLRYRVDFEVMKKPHRVADIVFPRLMIAIFVDGCFWHGCPEHATWPKQNAEFWRKKIETNRARDTDTNERLRNIGWTVLRFWEHEPPHEAADIVVQAVAMGRSKHNASSPGPHKKN